MKRIFVLLLALALLLQIAPCAVAEADGGTKLTPVKGPVDPYKPYDAY